MSKFSKIYSTTAMNYLSTQAHTFSFSIFHFPILVHYLKSSFSHFLSYPIFQFIFNDIYLYFDVIFCKMVYIRTRNKEKERIDRLMIKTNFCQKHFHFACTSYLSFNNVCFSLYTKRKTACMNKINNKKTLFRMFGCVFETKIFHTEIHQKEDYIKNISCITKTHTQVFYRTT